MKRREGERGKRRRELGRRDKNRKNKHGYFDDRSKRVYMYKMLSWDILLKGD